MWEIYEILNFLKDGECHSLQEIIDGCSMQENKARLALKFLGQFDFIKMEEDEQKVSIPQKIRTFINQTDELNHLAENQT
jgi:predicted transcriptional regulator